MCWSSTPCTVSHVHEILFAAQRAINTLDEFLCGSAHERSMFSVHNKHIWNSLVCKSGKFPFGVQKVLNMEEAKNESGFLSTAYRIECMGWSAHKFDTKAHVGLYLVKGGTVTEI